MKRSIVFPFVVAALLTAACDRAMVDNPCSSRDASIGIRLLNDQMPAPGNYSCNRMATYSSSSIVVPIVFIPQGSSVNDFQIRQIRQALENVRFWYQRELPNKDIHWDQIKFLDGQNTAEHYRTDNNIWDEICGEIENAFGWNPWDGSSGQNHIALVLGRDLLAWAGGAGRTDGCGLAVVGLESLIDLSRVSSEWWGTQEYWHGTVIHELGHAFTLSHNDYPASIMNFHDNYKEKHLVRDESQQVESTAATTVKGPHPIARWTFDEMDAGGINDESSSSNTMFLFNGGCLESGLIESAGTFDGIDDRAITLENVCNVTDQLTVSAWVKPDRITGMQTIVNKWYAMDQYILLLQDGQYVFSVAFPGGTWGRSVGVQAPAVTGQWTHVAGVFNGSSILLYIDGVLVASAAASGTLQASTRPVCAGNHPSWNAFKGQIDMITIYDKALGRNQICTY